MTFRTITAEEQEALSLRFTYRSMMTMRLSTARYALFTRSFKLVHIGTWKELQSYHNPVQELPPEPAPKITSTELDTLLEDLL